MCPRKKADPEETGRLNQIIGRRARVVRTACALIQVDVAEDLGVTMEFYRRIECGQAMPSVRTFYRLAVALGVSADFLLGRGEMPEFASPGDAPPPYKSRGNPQEQQERKLLRSLRTARPETLRLILWVLNQIQRAARPPASRTNASAESSDGCPDASAMDTSAERSDGCPGPAL